MSSSLPLVALLDRQFIGVQYDTSIEQKVCDGVAKVECFNAEHNDQVPDKIEEAEAVLAWHHLTLNKEMIARMKKAKIIVRIGMGYDNVDVVAAGEKGIYVSNVPDYGVEEVADSAMCLLLNIMRKTHWVANTTHDGKWNSQEAVGATRLNGRTLGIIGLGRIGTATALRAKAFSLNVIFYDPFLEYGRAKALGIGQVDTLEELLQQSDIISVHCPLTHQGKSNQYLLNKETFKHVKKGCVIINTARGPIIQEEALVEALKDGRVRAAGLDVFEKEPYMSGPLLSFPNVIVTPHSAFYSDQGHVEMVSKAASEARRVITGKEPLYCVNRQFLKK